MSGQIIFAVNHVRKEIMKIGHTTWDADPSADIKTRIQLFAPFNLRGREMFFTRAFEFQIEELMLEDAALQLGYTRTNSYWNRVESSDD